jgi:hypothetical protein
LKTQVSTATGWVELVAGKGRKLDELGWQLGSKT